MKIAMIGQKYVPSREGGIEVVVDNLSTRLASLNHEVTLFNRKRKDYPPISEYKGCKVINIFTINKKSLDAIVYAFFATLKARRMAKKGLFDVIHFHAEGTCFFLRLFPNKKHRNFKLVVTIHGLDWQRGKWGGLASKVILHGEKSAVKYADEIIVLSKNNKQYFYEKYHRSVNYIPNGINMPIFHEPDIIKRKFNLDKNSYVLFLARIVPEKGLHYLIDAWKIINNKFSFNKKLVIAGGDSHCQTYFNEIMEKIKNDNSIIATGFVDGQLLQELFSNACLYVLPSDIEGMPMSLLEALSYNLPCLVSDIPENTQLINDLNLVFKHGNVNDLTDKLIYFLNLNDKSLDRNLDLPPSWDSIVSKTISIYKKGIMVE